MNAQRDGERRQRWLGIAGAVAVIAIPVALIAATWQPLEPLPPRERPAVLLEEPSSDRSREERRRNRDVEAAEQKPTRNERHPGEASPPAEATPHSGTDA